MGELILCQGRIAAMPYYIEQIGWNIYSIEELCDYIEQYPDRLDEDFFGPELRLWLKQELHMEELADRLQEKQKDHRGLSDLVGLVLRSCGYLSGPEREGVLRQLKELEGKDAFEREKIHADRCLKNRRYAEGILEYQKLIKAAEKAGRGAAEVGNIWHNMGVACANMFLYEQAEWCLKKAYQYNNQPESLIEMYLAGQCISGGEAEASQELPEEWRQQVMSRLQEADAQREEPVFRQTKEQLENWKKTYRFYSRLQV